MRPPSCHDWLLPEKLVWVFLPSWDFYCYTLETFTQNWAKSTHPVSSSCTHTDALLMRGERRGPDLFTVVSNWLQTMCHRLLLLDINHFNMDLLSVPSIKQWTEAIFRGNSFKRPPSAKQLRKPEVTQKAIKRADIIESLITFWFNAAEKISSISEKQNLGGGKWLGSHYIFSGQEILA